MASDDGEISSWENTTHGHMRWSQTWYSLIQPMKLLHYVLSLSPYLPRFCADKQKTFKVIGVSWIIFRTPSREKAGIVLERKIAVLLLLQPTHTWQQSYNNTTCSIPVLTWPLIQYVVRLFGKRKKIGHWWSIEVHQTVWYLFFSISACGYNKQVNLGKKHNIAYCLCWTICLCVLLL